MLSHHFKVTQALAASLTELGRGLYGTAFPKQPEKMLKLYEFEGCPYCRSVREVLTLLNLDVEIYPCPKNGTRFRPIIKALDQKIRFPFLIDDNTGEQIADSQKIIAHLFKHYSAEGKIPLSYRIPSIVAFGVAGTMINGFYGLVANQQNKKVPIPEQLLHLWSFEASPFSRVVRAKLTELELPYVLHNVAKERWQDMGMAKLRVQSDYQPLAGGKREQVMQYMGGKIQLPYLEDPNTGVNLFESYQIIEYLKQQYGR